MKRGHVEHLLCGYIDGALSRGHEPVQWRRTWLPAAIARGSWRDGAPSCTWSPTTRPMSCPTDCAETVLRILEARRGERLIDGASDAQPLDACGSSVQSDGGDTRLLSLLSLLRVAAAVAALALIGWASHRLDARPSRIVPPGPVGGGDRAHSTIDGRRFRGSPRPVGHQRVSGFARATRCAPMARTGFRKPSVAVTA